MLNDEAKPIRHALGSSCFTQRARHTRCTAAKGAGVPSIASHRDGDGSVSSLEAASADAGLGVGERKRYRRLTRRIRRAGDAARR